MIGIENQLLDQALISIQCEANQMRMRAQTQASIGMRAEALVRLSTESEAVCSNSIATLIIPSMPNVQSLTLIIRAGMDYD